MDVVRWIWRGYGIVDMVFSRVVMSVKGYSAVIECTFLGGLCSVVVTLLVKSCVKRSD